MTKNKEQKALLFEHKLYISSTENSDSFKEYFIPYSTETLLENNLLTAPAKILLYHHSDKQNNIDFTNLLKFYSISDGVWVNENGKIEEISLFDYLEDIMFLTEIAKHPKNDNKNVANGFMGILGRILFFQLKVDISFLFAIVKDVQIQNFIQSNKDIYAISLYEIALHILCIDESKKDSYTFEKIKNASDIAAFIKKFIYDLYDFAQNYLIENYSASADTKLLTKLLNAMTAISSMPSKYKVNKQGCFCIATNSDKIYFSLSGGDLQDNKNINSGFINQVIHYLAKQFKIDNKDIDKKIIYCIIDEKTKAYGIKTDLGFSFFEKPITFSQTYGNYFPFFTFSPFPAQNDLIGKLYGCCERKIFTHIDNDSPLTVHCRWAPCAMCKPAVDEQKKLHSNFEFIALAENFESFEKDVLKNGIKNKQVLRI